MTLEFAGFTLYQRKNWAGKIGLCLLLFAVISLASACDATWVSQAQSLIPVIASAIEGALALLLTFGVGLPPGLSSAIQVAANAAVEALRNIVTPLIQQYKDAPAEDKATALGKLKTALDDVATKFVDILNAIHVENPALQTKLTSIFGAIQAMVLSLLNIIPALPKLTSLEAVHQYEADGGVIPMTAGQFKHHYKTIFKMKTGDPSVDKVVEKAPVFGKVG